MDDTAHADELLPELQLTLTVKVTTTEKAWVEIDRACCEKLGWSKEDLAEASGISEATIDTARRTRSSGYQEKSDRLKLGHTFEAAGVLAEAQLKRGADVFQLWPVPGESR